MNDRRKFFRNALSFGLGASLLASNVEASSTGPPARVQTPDVPDLPFTLDNGVKVFHLVAEPVKQQLVPGRTVDLWGYNGSAPGPTIQVNQGDRVRLIVDNHLPEPTAMHWHGFEIPNNMDGAPGISQEPIDPGERFIYEFTLHQEGTYFYHSHMAMQEMLGMLGAFIMHPKQAYTPVVDKDFVLMLQEYWILPNNSVPNTMNMEFNWLTINGKSAPATEPLIVRLGDRVRIRMINLGMDHHPMHVHGHTFWITGTEGGRIPQSAWVPGNTVLVGVAQARDIEFVANNPGDWMLHCHLPHHMMNHMAPVAGPMSRMHHAGMAQGGMAMEGIAHDANQVPGFPQDAYMEGPMMAMQEVEKRPYNYGLRPGWSGYMQGMMTLLRVLPPDRYDRLMNRIGQERAR